MPSPILAWAAATAFAFTPHRPAAVASTAAAGDSAAIVALMQKAAEGWSNHDPKEYSSMMAEDADFTTGVMPVIHGHDPYEQHHVPIFQGIYSASHLSNTLRSIRYITPTIASVDWDWKMTGINTPDGQPAPDRAGLVNWLMVKDHGQWWVKVMHNANAPPPAPPPAPAR